MHTYLLDAFLFRLHHGSDFSTLSGVEKLHHPCILRSPNTRCFLGIHGMYEGGKERKWTEWIGVRGLKPK